MMKKMIAILLIAITVTLFSAEKYAVLIAGDYNPTDIWSAAEWNGGSGKPYTEFWNDTYLMWELLTQEKGFKPENVIVLFAKGTDLYDVVEDGTPLFDWIVDRYRPIRHGITTPITNYAATEANVQAVCADLNSKMVHGDDFLFVWTMGHSSGSSIYLLKDDLSGNEPVDATRFADYFKSLNAMHKVYWLNMNYAENVSEKLEEDNALFINSTQYFGTGTGK